MTGWMGFLAMASLLAFWPFSSGGKTYRMTPGAMVPAATGTVQVSKDKTNHDLKLDIKVKHLANPSSLTPSASVYIVWVRPNGGAPIKQGAIGVDSNLNGELQVVTTAKAFDIFITAEQTENVTAPSGPVILQAHVSP